MNNEWALLPMRPSNELLGDAAALRDRLDEDSYLYFQSVLDPAAILRLREQMLLVLERHKWVEGGPALLQGVAKGRPTQEGKDEYAVVYDDVQRLEEFHSLAHDERLLAVMHDVVGETAFPHPLKIARLMFPDHAAVTTPPHQDYRNNQGTAALTAAWIPVGDCPRELGPLAVLRGSHRWGPLPRSWHEGPGNRQAILPPEMLDELRWVTTDFAAGDVLLFPSLTVHASLHNATELEMRLSVDFRYQREGESLTAGCLEPHLGRLSWEDVYSKWSSDRFQYYWKAKQFEVVPFADETEFEAVAVDESTELPEGWETFTKQDWEQLTRDSLTPEQRREIVRALQVDELRYQRRLRRLEELRSSGQLYSDPSRN